MAIKGLTPQLAERGRIKIGGLGEERKKQGSNETYRLPVKYDHIDITTMQRDAAGRLMPDTALMERFKQEQGVEKLTEIPVRLLYDDLDLNFLTRYAVYKGKTCWCTGDGEMACRQGEGEIEGRQAKTNEYGMVKCPCERVDPTYAGPDKCKTLGTLQVLLSGVDRVGGVWKFRTTSWNSVNAILSSLRLIQTLTGGPLAGIPLHLVLSPKTVTVPAGRQAGQTMVVYVVSLEYRGPEEKLAEIGYDIRKRQIEHRVRMDLIEEQARKLLVAPHQESADLQAETAEEFYPSGASPEPESVTTIPKKTKPSAPPKPPGEAKTGPPKHIPGSDPKGATAPGAQAQSPRNGGDDKAVSPGITLPALMELVKKSDALVDLPIPLITTKGVKIGRWIDWNVNLGGEMQVTLEFADNLKELAQGLTVEDVKKAFNEANLNLVISTAAEVEEGRERLEGVLEPDAASLAAASARTSTGNGGRVGARKSLF